ncbi:MAG: DUF3417 domain-containing protein [Desulfobacterales bacterium]
MENTQPTQPLFPHLPERLAGLKELAENLWWGWNPDARMLFKTLDRLVGSTAKMARPWSMMQGPRIRMAMMPKRFTVFWKGRSFRYITKSRKKAFPSNGCG